MSYLYQISTNSRFEQEVMLHHLINVIKNAKKKKKKTKQNENKNLNPIKGYIFAWRINI